MFERFSEPARRTVFFARYEASQFGSPRTETEHLLLGLLREDKALANHLLGSYARVEALRARIADHGYKGPKISTSIDIPLSYESRRAMAYGAAECELLRQKQIGTHHLLLGLLREEKCFAAQLLRDHGVTENSVREFARQREPASRQAICLSLPGLTRWLSAREADGRWIVDQPSSVRFAIYATNRPVATGDAPNLPPDSGLAQIQARIDLLARQVEQAIAGHEFAKANSYFAEEGIAREDLRRLCAKFNLTAPPPRVPLLRIEVVNNDAFSDLLRRCETYLEEGVAEVWLLDTALRRAFTITRTGGLREFKGGTLRTGEPPLEMDLATIFE